MWHLYGINASSADEESDNTGQLSMEFYFGNMSMYQQLILHQKDLLQQTAHKFKQ